MSMKQQVFETSHRVKAYFTTLEHTLSGKTLIFRENPRPSKTSKVKGQSALPLALLHLAAGPRAPELPVFYPNLTYFDPKIAIRRRERNA